VVKEGFDYSPYLADPDLLVEWDYIEEIVIKLPKYTWLWNISNKNLNISLKRLLQNQPPSCPICLSLPTAAQITRCGHVFCWPCMLHYLALSDDPWRKCPICFEAVHRRQLRSARFFAPERNFQENSTVTLQLMRRDKGAANFVAPVAKWRRRNGPEVTSVTGEILFLLNYWFYGIL